LSNVYWSTSAGKPQVEQTKGLLGYVLAKRRVCFPTSGRAANASGMRLFAKLTDNSQAVEIPAAR